MNPISPLSCGNQPIYVEVGAIRLISEILDSLDYSNVAILADENTAAKCVHLLGLDLPTIIVPAGEKSKSLDIAKFVWDQFRKLGLDRHSIVINVGGGMVCDLGGFCSSIYKRGIRFIHIPTSLLAMTDAAIGGKTGIDHENLKNHLGTFCFPEAVIVDPYFLKTLPKEELQSGSAESLKHSLIADKELWKEIDESAEGFFGIETIRKSIEIKVDIVSQDPHDDGPRKALNFGHTIGHALEMLSVSESASPVSHGFAVAAGMICEAKISYDRGMITKEELNAITDRLASGFEPVQIDWNSIDVLLNLITNDKKNKKGVILCTLLNGIGDFQIDCNLSQFEIRDSLEYYSALSE